MAEFANADGPTNIVGTGAGDSVGVDFENGYDGEAPPDNDTIATADGNDIIYITPGADVIDGGAGTDRLEIARWYIIDGIDSTLVTSWVVDMAAGTYQVSFGSLSGSGTFSNIEVFWGGPGSDQFFGTDGDDQFVLNAGANQFDGRAGYDMLETFGYTADSIIRDHVAVNAAQGNWTGLDGVVSSFTNIEEFRLTDGGDTFIGSDADEVVVPRKGGDTLDGGGGTDTVDYMWSYAGVTLDLKQGSGTLDGATQSIKGFEVILGSLYDDRLSGSKVNETISGSSGDDFIFGGGGADIVSGGAGDDDLRGGAGSDRLEGQIGTDRLTGGKGADTFVLYADGRGGADTIADFQFGIDTLLFV